jgi:hypothetical protein
VHYFVPLWVAARVKDNPNELLRSTLSIYRCARMNTGGEVAPSTLGLIVNSKQQIRGRDTAVGIATRYGLEGRGIESRWGRDFSQPSRPALGTTQPPIQRVPGLFPGGKAAGAWR